MALPRRSVKDFHKGLLPLKRAAATEYPKPAKEAENVDPNPQPDRTKSDPRAEKKQTTTDFQKKNAVNNRTGSLPALQKMPSTPQRGGAEIETACAKCATPLPAEIQHAIHQYLDRENQELKQRVVHLTRQLEDSEERLEAFRKNIKQLAGFQ